MSRQAHEVCAQCHKFAMKEYPEQAKEGRGRCTGYDGSFAPLRDPFVSWDSRACVRYMRSPNQAARLQWFQKQQQEQNNSEVQPETKG